MKRNLVLFALALGLTAASAEVAQADGYGFGFSLRGTFNFPLTTGCGYPPVTMWPGYNGYNGGYGVAAGSFGGGVGYGGTPGFVEMPTIPPGYPTVDPGSSGYSGVYPPTGYPYGGYARPGPELAVVGNAAGQTSSGYGYSAHFNASVGRYGYPYDSYDQAYPSVGPAYPLGWDANAMRAGGFVNGFPGTPAYRP